jgi:hypothetical protein
MWYYNEAERDIYNMGPVLSMNRGNWSEISNLHVCDTEQRVRATAGAHCSPDKMRQFKHVSHVNTTHENPVHFSCLERTSTRAQLEQNFQAYHTRYNIATHLMYSILILYWIKTSHSDYKNYAPLVCDAAKCSYLVSYLYCCLAWLGNDVCFKHTRICINYKLIQASF